MRGKKKQPKSVWKLYIHELCLVPFAICISLFWRVSSSFCVSSCFSPSPLDFLSASSHNCRHRLSLWKPSNWPPHSPSCHSWSIVHSHKFLWNMPIKFYHSIPKTLYQLLIVAYGIWQFAEGLLTLHQKLVLYFPWHMAMLCFIVSCSFEVGS